MDRAITVSPFTLMELAVKHSIVSILSKPQWATKWQDAVIRAKWLDEIQHELLHRFYTHGRWWREKAATRRNLAALSKKPLAEIKSAQYSAPKKRHLDPAVVPRLVAFTRAALQDGDIAGNVRGALEAEGIDATPYTIAMLADVCVIIQGELRQVEAFIVGAINALAQEVFTPEALSESDSASGNPPTITISPTGVYGSWMSDTLIPEALKTKFVSEAAVLENVPDKEKDWHPNSGKKVLDLVHPSLFCCVSKRTRMIPEALNPDSFSGPADQMKQLWIPSDSQVQDDGSVRLLSYINNLHPGRHAELYRSIEAIFARFVPLFEHVLESTQHRFPEPVFTAPYEYDDYHVRPVPPPPSAVNVSLLSLPTTTSSVSMRGKTVQVIVKVAEILLTPKSPKYKGASWHIEGTNREEIAATGIYYFGSENIKDSRLSFRVSIEQPPYRQGEKNGTGLTYAVFDGSMLAQVLGSVGTIEDRCLAFPNVLQHKVELEDPSKPGVRKILAFFLVDPKKKIPSASVIPPQQHEWIEDLLQELETPVAKKRRVSAAAKAEAATERQALERSARVCAMTLDEAKAIRLELMKERSMADAADRDDPEKFFNLCEH